MLKNSMKKDVNLTRNGSYLEVQRGDKKTAISATKIITVTHIPFENMLKN
jgi:hypothetical protein